PAHRRGPRAHRPRAAPPWRPHGGDDRAPGRRRGQRPADPGAHRRAQGPPPREAPRWTWALALEFHFFAPRARRARAWFPFASRRLGGTLRANRRRDLMAANRLPALDFALGETADMLREQVEDFAASEIAPRAAEIDRSNEFPMDLWPKLGRLGVLGVTVPEQHGGAGMWCAQQVASTGEV